MPKSLNLMKTLCFVIPLALLVVAEASASSFNLTVQTDKASYLRGDPVTIFGQFTYNGWPVQSCSVALAVQDPYNITVFMGSAQTDADGKYNVTFRLSNQTELGTYTTFANRPEVKNYTTFQVIQILGDVNNDGKVDIRDIYLVAKAFGSDPSLPNWNPTCDINGDGKVDAKDYYIVCQQYGKTYA